MNQTAIFYVYKGNIVVKINVEQIQSPGIFRQVE